MLRCLGAVMIMTGCLGLGLWYRRRFLQRLKELRTMLEILEMFSSEIRYGKTTLPECCRRISERQSEPYREGLWAVYEIMEQNEGETFESVFCEKMTGCCGLLPVTKEDCSHFLSFVRESSFADEQMQLQCIEQSKELLKLDVERLSGENREKCRLAVGLGAMSGLLLVIILL